jgi:hypothetical protein
VTVSGTASTTPRTQILRAQALFGKFSPLLAGMYAAVRGEMAVVSGFVGELAQQSQDQAAKCS